MFELPEKVDMNDAVLAPLAVAGSAVSTGFAAVSAAGYDFSASALSLGSNMGLSVAGALAIVAFVIAWITNDRSLDDFRDNRSNSADVEQFLVLGAPAAIAGVELFPAIGDPVSGSLYIAGTVTLAFSAAFYRVAHR
jgi:hypothetical protein